MLVAWDTLEVPTYRHEKFPAYQSGREFDDALLEQLDLIPEFVAACGFQNAKAPGYEADDFLASAAHAEEKRGGTVLIASGDRDTFQLASDRTTILYPVRAGEMARVDPAEVRARYGVEPEQVPDFIALRGDPSDKLPGASGVGATGAATLLQRYGTLEAALAAGRFPTQAERLAAIQVDRDNEPEGSAAQPSQPEANLGQGGRTGAKVGAESTRQASRRACERLGGGSDFEPMESVMVEARKARAVGFNHVALEVGDIEEALAFYGRLFDFKLRGKSGTSAFIDLGDQFLALQKGRTQPADEGRHFGLVVDDKDAVRKALADAGIQPLPGPFLDFLDPWGNRIEIVSYDNVQFTKAPNVLRGMGLTHLSKNEQALKELTAKGMAPRLEMRNAWRRCDAKRLDHGCQSRARA